MNMHINEVMREAMAPMEPKMRSDTRFVSVERVAENLARSATVAYWQENSFSSSDYHASQVDDHFRQLARLLGYSIKKEAE